MGDRTGGSRTTRRQRDERQVRALLREQAGPQWGFLVFLWVFCVAVFWLLGRFIDGPSILEPPFYLVWATLLVGVEAVRQHRRVTKVGHARHADPVQVTITGLGRKEVTIERGEAALRVPVASTLGLKVGAQIWAAPEPRAGEHVVLVADHLRLGSLDLITPRGPAEPV